MDKKFDSWKNSLKRTFGRKLGRDVVGQVLRGGEETQQSERQCEVQHEHRQQQEQHLQQQQLLQQHEPRGNNRTLKSPWNTLRRSLGRRRGGEVLDLLRGDGKDGDVGEEKEKEKKEEYQDVDPPTTTTTAQSDLRIETDAQPPRLRVRTRNPFASLSGLGSPRRTRFQVHQRMSSVERRTNSVDGDAQSLMEIPHSGALDARSLELEPRGRGAFATWSCCSRSGLREVRPEILERPGAHGAVQLARAGEDIEVLPLWTDTSSAGAGADTSHDMAAVQASSDSQPASLYAETMDEPASSAHTLMPQPQGPQEEEVEGEEVVDRTPGAPHREPDSHSPATANLAVQVYQPRRAYNTIGHARAGCTSVPRPTRRVTKADVEAKCRSIDAMLLAGQRTGRTNPDAQLQQQTGEEEEGEEGEEEEEVEEVEEEVQEEEKEEDEEVQEDEKAEEAPLHPPAQNPALVEAMNRVLRHALQAGRSLIAEEQDPYERTSNAARLVYARSQAARAASQHPPTSTRAQRLRAPEPGHWLASSDPLRRGAESRARDVREWFVERERRNGHGSGRGEDVASTSGVGLRPAPYPPVRHDSESTALAPESVQGASSTIVAGPNRPRLLLRSRQQINRDSAGCSTPDIFNSEDSRGSKQIQGSGAESEQLGRLAVRSVHQSEDAEDVQTGYTDGRNDGSMGRMSSEGCENDSMESVVTTIYRGPVEDVEAGRSAK